MDNKVFKELSALATRKDIDDYITKKF